MIPDRRRAPRNAGFLLSETLAVLAISAFVLVGLASTAHFLTVFIDRSVVQAQEADILGRTLSALTRDISGLSRARWNGFEPQGFVFRGGPNSLYFAHRERGADGLGETRVIALREISTDAGPRLMRSEARLAATATSFDDLQFSPQRAVDTGPARLRFWYLSGSPKNRGVRQRSWQIDAQLPAAVVIEAVDATSTRLIVTANVPIHANADIGCLESESGETQPGPGGVPPAPNPVGGTAPTPAPQSGDAARSAPPGGTPQGTDPSAAGTPQGPGTAQAGSEAFCGRDDAKEHAPQQQPPTSPAPRPGTGTPI